MPEEFPSSAGFAAIGRTERTMLVYSTSGTLSYWNLKNEGGLRLDAALDDSVPLSFNVPGNLGSPLLFGNNRFFAGFDGAGLVLLQADTGFELDRDRSLTGGRLAARGDELYCLALSGGNAAPFTGREGIYRLRINDFGRFERLGFYPLPANTVPGALALVPREGALPLLVLGAQGGEILPLNPDFPYSSPPPLRVKNQTGIRELAAGEKWIAFLTGEHSLGYIPLDFLELEGTVLGLEQAGEYTRLSAAGRLSGAWQEEPADRFILWQDQSPLPSPEFRFPGAGSSPLPAPPRSFPLRSVSALGDRGLFLDLGGNVSVLSLTEGTIHYAETTAGSMDAAFIDEGSIILGRPSAGDPFLMIDTRTRETVPLPYPASIGAQVYRGPSGMIYAVTLDESAGRLETSIVRIETQESVYARPLVEYPGEEGGVSIAEADGFMASTLGGIYHPWGMTGFERGPALPRRIAGGDLYFIVLDGEGGISWHDPRTGEMLALFRLYEDEWTLAIAGSGLRRGRVWRR
jgi:hypothetical protein